MNVERIRLGVSKCLLGEPVRCDGRRKHDPFITDTLGRFFEFVEDCHKELVPRIVPVTMRRHCAEKHGIEYLKSPYHLNPHPMELKLRHHA